MKRSIGIDLGTTNSCVATIDESGKPIILTNKLGESTTPSMVSFRSAPDDESGERALVGLPAQRRAVSNPAETLYAVKRLIGRRFGDPLVTALSETLPYTLVAAANGDARIDVMGSQVSPPQVSSLVLRELADIARDHFGQDAQEAIITVPAHFDNTERRATVDAAEIAGIKVRRLLNEPTAAALGYGAHRGDDKRLAVCDLGGGTFDVSIVNIEGGVIEVISSQGDMFLGGDDADRAIMQQLLKELLDQGVDVGDDPQSLQRLKGEVVQVKHTLSAGRSACIDLLNFGVLPSGKPLHYKRTILRAEMNSWIAPVLRRLDAPCQEAVARCGLAPKDVDSIILVGGMTRMPAIQNRLASIFGRPPLKVVNPDEIVSIGAATQCAILDGLIEGVVLLDVTSQALGLLSQDGHYQQVISRNATIPTREHRIIVTTKNDQRELYFEVYEGSSDNVAANRQLGRFVCEDLPEAPAGEVMVLVEFTVDVDGILRVSTSELGTGSPRELRMRATTGLTRSEVEELR